MLADRYAAAFQSVDTTALCDADKSLRVMDSAIRPRSAGIGILGPAFTVRCQDDFFGALRAIEAAAPGDVVIVDGGSSEIALAGELFARGALVRGLGGIIVDGGYRDIGYVRECELPIYSRFITPMSGSTTELGELQVRVTCGGVPVSPGDMVLADQEGIVVVEPAALDGLLAAAAAVKQAESRVIAKLDAGATLSDCLNIAAHTEALENEAESALTFLV
ncbi:MULTISPECIES: RraA family protein [unclassified Nocardia]|uniref:RraA family protein n=1 Tax=unclassified Nocardia TaxID=2637762 RepID=UPI0035D71BD4